MSFRPERVFTGSSKNPTEYVRKDIVQEMLEQQREECWHRSQHFLSQAAAWDCMQGVKEACLNAVEKEDEL